MLKTFEYENYEFTYTEGAVIGTVEITDKAKKQSLGFVSLEALVAFIGEAYLKPQLIERIKKENPIRLIVG
jgi:hypothetical protein